MPCCAPRSTAWSPTARSTSATSSRPARRSSRSSIRPRCGSRRPCRRTRSSALSVGAAVQFSVRGYEQPFEGRIDRISPQADPTTRQVPIFVTAPNTGGRLVAGLFAEGRVVSSASEGLVVPLNAVNEAAGAPWVMRVNSGRTEKVNVTLGLRDTRTERVELVSGVAEGDVLLRGGRAGDHAGHPGQRRSREVAMFISDVAIKRPVITVVTMLALVVFGIVALLAARHRRVPRRPAADRGDRGALPGRVPRRRRARGRRADRGGALRDQRRRQDHVERRSTASATLIVQFVFEKDLQQATQEIRDEISAIRNELPLEMEEPILTRFDPADLPIVSLTLSSAALTGPELTRLADPDITRELRGLPGDRRGQRRRRRRARTDRRAAADGAAGGRRQRRRRSCRRSRRRTSPPPSDA